ncbi:hypothetical protein ABFS82_09G082800 [Erythranthe guttata]|nr:PREDICTED: uncharacterized protein LOC105976082 [Erythranthe guttata]|eukprot:XP_012856826.1 PREDICTED: uncharacterized protein LOC105976082 [Erythranthe guttata]
MGCGNPPALTDVEEGQERHSLTTKPSGADDSGRSHDSNTGADMSFPFSLNYPHFPVSNNENNILRGYTNSNCSTNSETNPNSINVENDKSPSFATATGYPIKAHGAEARNSGISMPQMSGNFSALPLVDNFGGAGNKNNTNVAPPPFRFPQKVDGSFLTLGIGGSTEVRSNSKFSTREIASKLEDADNSSLIGRNLDNPLSITQLTGSEARVQTSGGGLLNNLSGEGTTSRLSSVAVPRLQNMQSNTVSNFTARRDASSVIGSSAPSSLPYRSNLISRPQYANLPAWLVPETRNSAHFAGQPVTGIQDHLRQRPINVPSESSRNYLSDMQRGSSINHTQLGNLVTHGDGRRVQSSPVFRVPVNAQPAGNLPSRAESTSTGYANYGSSPSTVQPMGNSLASRNFGSVDALRNSLYPQISNSNGFQSAAPAAPFPRRLGVQPNDIANAITTIRGPPPPINLAPSPMRMAPPVNPFRPVALLGQYQNAMPPHLSRNFPRVDYSQGHVIPGANLAIRPPQPSPPINVPRPSLKRQQTENYLAPQHISQRRKILPQPVPHPSPLLLQRPLPGAPATLAPIPPRYYTPPALSHIKCCEATPEPIGEKCLLCKRDLSFTAEGPVFQPTIPPGAAVLPCGHTFHDHCLQKITPKDQSKCPPCIPCAIGET